MRMRPAVILARAPVLAAALLVAVLPLAALPAADQPLVLDRPAHVGERTGISASCRSQQHRGIAVDAQPAKAQEVDFTVAFTGEREVLAVSAQGQPTRLRLTVASLTRTVSGKPALVMQPAGAQLVAEAAGGGTEFRDGDGKELPEAVEQALRLVLDLGDGTPLHDQALGSAQPRAVGEQWAISPVPAARLLAGLRILVDPAMVSGNAAVAAREPGPAPGQELLRITAALAFSAFTVPALPAGLAVTRSAGTLALERRYPGDPALPLLGETRLLSESLAAQGTVQQNGGEHALAITMELVQTNELHLVPHDPAGR